MIARNETELAKRLGVTRAGVASWRREYADAPRGRDVAEWEQFLEAYGLGRRAPNRVSFPPGGLRAHVEERIILAEMALGQAALSIQKHVPEHYRAFELLRRRFFQLTFPLYKVAAKL